MFDNFLFSVPGSSCVDWLGFDGARLFVRLKNWREQKQTVDHAYVYPCSLEQFNRLLSAPSIGKFYNDWFRFLYTAEHGTFRDLTFTCESYIDLHDVDCQLPKTVMAFQTLQYLSRTIGEQAFEEVISLYAVVPAFYPGAVRIISGARVNPSVVGLFVVPVQFSTILVNVQARVMAFRVPSMICSLLIAEGYIPVHGTLKEFGSCVLQLPNILEV